ncbi:hypothetical protein N9W06_03355 [Candidatus Marinimicrobia bacterium]|nr:hypothetical protein [Candidatus Neomarinimicrobiota bacterium]
MYGVTFFDIASSSDYIVGAHSHNDYKNETPLEEALENNFKSIEVDIFLFNKNLYVGHSWFELKKYKTIETMYLEPLWERYLANNETIYKNTSLYLLVDVKTNALKTYKYLEVILNKYKPMLTHVSSDSLKKKAVTIILSGNRPPINYFDSYDYRNVFIDGRLSDIGKGISYKMMPLISSDWNKSFDWDGVGVFPSPQKEVLDGLVNNVHLEKKEIRFWGSPDNQNTWGVLLFADVDLINTDSIEKCKNFIIKTKY